MPVLLGLRRMPPALRTTLETLATLATLAAPLPQNENQDVEHPPSATADHHNHGENRKSEPLPLLKLLKLLKLNHPSPPADDALWGETGGRACRHRPIRRRGYEDVGGSASAARSGLPALRHPAYSVAALHRRLRTVPRRRLGGLRRGAGLGAARPIRLRPNQTFRPHQPRWSALAAQR